MMKGILYLVSTPIGNLGDISARALQTLKDVDIIAAEDTRRTLKLLNHYEIKKHLVSYREQNRAKCGEYLTGELLGGKSIALVSDAGTPVISDPGEDLVRLAVSKEIRVTAIPGAVAAVTGLILSAFPASRYVFEGFLPAKKKERIGRLNSLADEERTIVFYEAPHKLVRTLEDIAATLGDRKITLARELTKKHEEVIRLTVGEALQMYRNDAPLGEFVLVVEGLHKPPVMQEDYNHDEINVKVDAFVRQGMSRKDAIKAVAAETGMSRRDIYKEVQIK